MTKVYHNPRCSKSRITCEALKNAKEEFEVVEYLKNPISKVELEEVIRMLGITPFELVRKGESIYKEQFKGKDLSDDQWIAAMIEYPKLMERPIVVKNGKAAIGRPVEKVLEIL